MLMCSDTVLGVYYGSYYVLLISGVGQLSELATVAAVDKLPVSGFCLIGCSNYDHRAIQLVWFDQSCECISRSVKVRLNRLTPAFSTSSPLKYIYSHNLLSCIRFRRNINIGNNFVKRCHHQDPSHFIFIEQELTMFYHPNSYFNF